jgi:hypothetical protein
MALQAPLQVGASPARPIPSHPIPSHPIPSYPIQTRPAPGDMARWPSSRLATSRVRPPATRHPPQQCGHCSRAAKQAGAQVGGTRALGARNVPRRGAGGAARTRGLPAAR